MEKIKGFVKENWIWILGGILLTTIILYLANRKKKQEILRNPEKAIIRGSLAPTTENLGLEALKTKLDECNKKYSSVRLSAGAVRPCGLLQDQYSAALKSASTESSYNGQFAGAFDKTNGLNVTDFAMGMEGTALLEDKNL